MFTANSDKATTP